MQFMRNLSENTRNNLELLDGWQMNKQSTKQARDILMYKNILIYFNVS